MRCGYCGIHEKLYPDGAGSFCIDHFTPKSQSPSEADDPSNLVYACRRCNNAKADITSSRFVNPNIDRLLDHLRFEKSGEVVGITEKGDFTIQVLALNSPILIEFRHRAMAWVEEVEKFFSPNASKSIANLSENELSEFHKALIDLSEGWGIVTTIAEKASSVAVVVREMAASLCALIARYPQALNEVEWRDLERIVAEALQGIGFSVELTRSAKDGGKDVVAECIVQNSNKVFYVEIKHWRKGGQPGTSQVSDFVEVNARDRTDGGLFLSSSGFTDSVYRQLGSISRQRIRLGERDKIVSICQHYVKKQQGIWQSLSPLPEVLFEGTLG